MSDAKTSEQVNELLTVYEIDIIIKSVIRSTYIVIVQNISSSVLK